MTVHESAVKSTVAGQLLRLLIWNFAGEVEARLAPIARIVLRYEQRIGKRLPANVKKAKHVSITYFNYSVWLAMLR